MTTLARTFEHEQLELFHDRDSGLSGAIAVHSTVLGPSMGGLRVRAYPDLDAAAVDALRLARAMTLKNSSAGLNFGGGKAVLVDDGHWDDRQARMLAFAEVVDQLAGRYITAEDVGTTAADMDTIATRTRWVVGRSPQHGGGGDPSPATARTVFGAIEAAVRTQFGSLSLTGVHVGVLGAGKVGRELVSMLSAAGAAVTVADVDRARAGACSERDDSVMAVPLDGFLGRDFDVLAPCAFGELIAAADVPSLSCRIVAGAANNILVDRNAAVALHEADILYVPDFVANSGGIIRVACEYEGLGEAAVATRLDAAIERAAALLEEAAARDALPLDVAVERALERIEGEAGRTKPIPVNGR